MFIFNRTPSKILPALLPEGYVDIHSHLLPGIDDGAKNVNDTLLFLKQLSNYGFNRFITTPHIMPGIWDNSSKSIIAKEQETLSFFKKDSHLYNLKAAAEYFIDEHFMPLLDVGDLLTLDDKHILIELSYLSAPLIIYDIIFKLKSKGYIPVLAHPERYKYFNDHDYHKLKKAGCKFQLNLLSLTGYYGSRTYRASEKLINNYMIDFTGSDIHNEKHIRALESKILFKNYDQLQKILDKNLVF